MTVLGTLLALLAQSYGGWILASGMVALAAMILVGNLAKITRGPTGAGLTTEIAMLVMFAVGAALVAGHVGAAVAVGGGVAVLLHLKRPLHELVARFGEADLRAIIRLVLIGLVILPALPNRAFGPYDVLNPFTIWLMVVLITGISLAAYATSKLVGPHKGILLTGLLGGLISSTATTVSFSRVARAAPDQSRLAAVVIVLASTVVFGRVLIEIAIVAPGALRATAPPIVIMMVFTGALASLLYVLSRPKIDVAGREQPPADLAVAIVFGLLYAVIVFGVAAAKDRFGAGGIYTVAALSGLTDMDAITLSTAQLIKAERLDTGTGWRAILIASMSNLVLKAIAVAALGNARVFARVIGVLAASFVAGLALLLFWPS